MPQHVIIDGSNLATEGRTLPSLKQLNEAIASYRDDHPDVLITVVVDATFGHRIDTKEVPEFERAIETNAFVAPPAGAVGRGDGFILSIAQKANASILSNDSYQEFHGEYNWLFDDGRLIGGKPVPHVGWVFVNRVPVRGPTSRRSVKEQKIVDKSPSRGRGRKAATENLPSISADGPMPIPKTPPPRAVVPDEPKSTRARTAEPAPERSTDGRSASTAARSANDLLVFLSFVEHYPVGTAVTAVVESYSSHGAYVTIGEAKGYVPLRLMADPAPRSAREVMALEEMVTLVVASFGPSRRSIDLAVPAMAPPSPPLATPKARKAAAKKSAAGTQVAVGSATVATEQIAAAAIAAQAVEASAAVEQQVPPLTKRRKAAPKKAAAIESPTAEPNPGRRSRSKAVGPTVDKNPGGTSGDVTASPAPTAAAAKKQAARPRKAAPATSRAEPATFDSVFSDQAPGASTTEEVTPPPASDKKAPRRRSPAAASSKSVDVRPAEQAEQAEQAEPVTSAPLAKKTAARRRTAPSRSVAPATDGGA